MSPGPRTKASHRLAIAFATMLTASCNVGPDFQAPAPPTETRYTPEATATALPGLDGQAGPILDPGTPVPDRWWTQFHSDALDRLVAQALAANPTIAIADATLRQSLAQARATKADQLPQADIGYGATRARESRSQSDPIAQEGVYLYSLHTSNVSVSYDLDLFGGKRRATESARASAQADGWRLAAAQRTIAAQTVVAAIEEAGLRAQVATGRANLDAARKTLELLHVREANGAIGAADIAAQESAVAQAQGALADLEQAHGEQVVALSILLGQDPARPIAETVDLARLTLPDHLPLLLPAQLVRQRPDIQACEADLHAAAAGVGVAIAARLPQITLSADAGGEATDFTRQFQSGNPFWTLLGGVTQPLFHGGALRAQQRAAEAALDGAKAQYRSSVLAAFGEVANALRALSIGNLRLDAALRADTAAQRNLAYQTVRLRAGGTGTLELLNATTARIQTANDLILARTRKFTDVVALYQALGGSRTDVAQGDPATAAGKSRNFHGHLSNK